MEFPERALPNWLVVGEICERERIRVRMDSAVATSGAGDLDRASIRARVQFYKMDRKSGLTSLVRLQMDAELGFASEQYHLTSRGTFLIRRVSKCPTGMSECSTPLHFRSVCGKRP